MLGPDVAWSLAVSAILFSIGALGVLLRRSPLIVLLSLEIMLNGGNLALIAFSRRNGEASGQVFAIAVMAVAASEGVVGLGLIVAMSRRRLAPGLHKLPAPRRWSPPPGSSSLPRPPPCPPTPPPGRGTPAPP